MNAKLILLALAQAIALPAFAQDAPKPAAPAPAPVSAEPQSTSAAFGDWTLRCQRVAEGDYVHFGQVAMTTPGNQGDIANLGIIIGRDAIAVVDTGGSVSVGRRLLLALLLTLLNQTSASCLSTMIMQ